MIANIDRRDLPRREAPVEIAIGIDPGAGANWQDGDPAEPARQTRGGGPRTVEGRDESRRNALKDGLAAEVVFPEDLRVLIDRRNAQFDAQFAPRNDYEAMLVGRMAVAQGKIDHCDALIATEQTRVKDRVANNWDQDRDEEVDRLANRLAQDPVRVARALGRTLHGTRWLIREWEGLAGCLRNKGDWNESQRGLALDLLGVRPDLRDGSGELPPGAGPSVLSALAERQLGRLREQLEERTIEDEKERQMAAAGLGRKDDPATARLRRYEAAGYRVFHWAHAELQKVQALPCPRIESKTYAERRRIRERLAEPDDAPPEPRPTSAPDPPPGASVGRFAKGRTATIADDRDVIRIESKAPEASVPSPPAVAVAVAGTPAPALTRPASTPFGAKPLISPPAPRNRHERRAQEAQARQSASVKLV